MPNVAYIQVISGYEPAKTIKGKTLADTKTTPAKTTYEEVMVFPLFEDFKMEVGSDFTSFGDMFGSIASLLSKGVEFYAGATGTTTEGLANFQNILDVPRWDRTRPIKFQLTLPFFTMNNPKTDVIDPMNKIINLTILTYNKSSKTFSIPGLSASVMKQATKEANTNNKDKSTIEKLVGPSAKLISIRIPGIIYMPLAFVREAVPTYSKQVVNDRGKDYPLWGKLECQIEGLYPALDENFEYPY